MVVERVLKVAKLANPPLFIAEMFLSALRPNKTKDAIKSPTLTFNRRRVLALGAVAGGAGATAILSRCSGKVVSPQGEADCATPINIGAAAQTIDNPLAVVNLSSDTNTEPIVIPQSQTELNLLTDRIAVLTKLVTNRDEIIKTKDETIKQYKERDKSETDENKSLRDQLTAAKQMEGSLQKLADGAEGEKLKVVEELTKLKGTFTTLEDNFTSLGKKLDKTEQAERIGTEFRDKLIASYKEALGSMSALLDESAVKISELAQGNEKSVVDGILKVNSANSTLETSDSVLDQSLTEIDPVSNTVKSILDSLNSLVSEIERLEQPFGTKTGRLGGLVSELGERVPYFRNEFGIFIDLFDSITVKAPLNLQNSLLSLESLVSRVQLPDGSIGSIPQVQSQIKEVRGEQTTDPSKLGSGLLGANQDLGVIIDPLGSAAIRTRMFRDTFISLDQLLKKRDQIVSENDANLKISEVIYQKKMDHTNSSA